MLKANVWAKSYSLHLPWDFQRSVGAAIITMASLSSKYELIYKDVCLYEALHAFHDLDPHTRENNTVSTDFPATNLHTYIHICTVYISID